MLDTPVLFLIFNRPDSTAIVFEQIRRAEPKQLFIAADGPRSGKFTDEDLCRQTRERVLNSIDWQCEVQTLLRDTNLGCGLAVSEAITWFFSYVEHGIILEDDCLPNQDFFRFTQAMLMRYWNVTRIKSICGTNIHSSKGRLGNSSYYFSSYGSIWGWATWRRAWDEYDYTMKDYPKTIERVLADRKRYSDIKIWADFFRNTFEKKIDTWDFQWVYAIWKTGGLCIIPNYNLVSNIGFGPNSTHTSSKSDIAYLKTELLPKDIIFNDVLVANNKADDHIATKFIGKRPFYKHLFGFLKPLYKR